MPGGACRRKSARERSPHAAAQRLRAGPARVSLPSFFTDASLQPGSALDLAESVAHHLRVRRLAVGEELLLLDGRGHRALATLETIGRRDARVLVRDVTDSPPLPAVHLLVPISDRERMLWLAEKATELGVSSWRPVAWRRSRSVTPRGEGAAFAEKVRLRSVAALEQSGGAWLPSIHADASPAAAIAEAPVGARLVLDAGGAPMLHAPVVAPVTLAIGPEGGLEADELELLRAAGFRAASLAGNMLRFETAAVAALAVARAALTPTESSHG